MGITAWGSYRKAPLFTSNCCAQSKSRTQKINLHKSPWPQVRHVHNQRLELGTYIKVLGLVVSSLGLGKEASPYQQYCEFLTWEIWEKSELRPRTRPATEDYHPNIYTGRFAAQFCKTTPPSSTPQVDVSVCRRPGWGGRTQNCSNTSVEHN